MQTDTRPQHEWLLAGDEIFPAMLAAMAAARSTICLEIYIYAPGRLADRFRAAMTEARQRGVAVRVLVDAVGSIMLAKDYWRPLCEAGGVVRQFNPVALNRFWIRNHRKLLVCDGHTAFVGGFNIAPEYEGDGIKRGWWDVGLKITGPVAVQLAVSFEEMFGRAEFRHKHFARLRKTGAKKSVALPNDQILYSGPGRGLSPFKHSLHADLARAADVQIMVAYFLPPLRLRRALLRVVRRGGRVRLILAGKTDVRLAKLAAQSLYRRLLKGKIEIYEYQPQILHAKLIMVDEAVYVGSSNLDPRSLHINYELMVRVRDETVTAEARTLLAASLAQSRRVSAEEWRQSRTFYDGLKQRWAAFLLNRIDPYLARRQWRSLPE
jgi:cardiolipin synthase